MLHKVAIGSAIVDALLIGGFIVCMIYASIYYVDVEGNRYEESHPTRVYEVYKVEHIQVSREYNNAARCAAGFGMLIVPCSIFLCVVCSFVWKEFLERREQGERQREEEIHRNILEAPTVASADLARGLGVGGVWYSDLAEDTSGSEKLQVEDASDPEEEPKKESNRFDNIEL